MGDIYFCFSDECGDYSQTISLKQLKIHPFYIRASLLVNANEWKKLNRDFTRLKKTYSIPNDLELKWAHLWQVKCYQKGRLKKVKDPILGDLLEYSHMELLSFVKECLELQNTLEEKYIIITYTRNNKENRYNEKMIIRFHLQELMQRLEMELQKSSSNLGLIFFDPVNERKNELFRNIYKDFLISGDFIKSYKHLKDSLNFENSHHSVGVQLADYISGAFSAVLKSTGPKSYQDGVKLFMNNIHPHLRRV